MNQAPHYQSLVEQLNVWLRQSAEIETRTLVNGIDFLKEWIETGVAVNTEEFKNSSQYLIRDLQHFLINTQRDADESAFYLSFKDSLWQQLANMADKTQLEWQQFSADLAHDGIYKSGEEIGFGTLSCKQCKTQKSIAHPQKIKACVECGSELFVRLS